MGLVEDMRLERKLPSPQVAKLVREMAGVSQSRVAHELGVRPSAVSRWEGGRRRPRGALLVRYVELLESLQAESRL